MDSIAFDSNSYWIETNIKYSHWLVPSVVAMQVDMDNVECITETALTIRKTRRRTTVPKAIVEALELTGEDRLRWILFKDHSVMITKVKQRGESD